MWRVYVLECTAKTGRVTIHVGISKNPATRVEQHRAGMVKATRGRSIELLGVSDMMAHRDALRLEVALKAMDPQRKRSWARRQING
jgi:predicted GIY-YIG superfamily endonuclease